MDNLQEKNNTVIGRMAQIYPQLYLNPDVDDIDQYKEVILRGKMPAKQELTCFHCDPRDKEDLVSTPVGDVRVVTIYNRHDFEIFNRSMMAAKEGPENVIPPSQGAATLITFNWNRIHEHQRQFIEEQHKAGVLVPDWAAEWKRFTAVKSNYVDTLVVLSIGPYSNIQAERIGVSAEEWLELSDTIRKYHELTHVICRSQYPDQINAVWDELVADAIGLYAAYGFFDPETEKVFLGIQGEEYIGGRLENYTDDAVGITARVSAAIEGLDSIIKEHPEKDPFSLIPFLEAQQGRLFG